MKIIFPMGHKFSHDGSVISNSLQNHPKFSSSPLKGMLICNILVLFFVYAQMVTTLWIYRNSLAALVYLNMVPPMLNSVSFIASNIFRFLWGHKNEANYSTLISKKCKTYNRIWNDIKTSCRPVWSVIIRAITKSDDRSVGVRFVHHEYDYRLNWTTRSLITN